jgi:hypothetical protein
MVWLKHAISIYIAGAGHPVPEWSNVVSAASGGVGDNLGRNALRV